MDSQDNAPHHVWIETRVQPRLEASKDFILQASAMFNPKRNKDAKCNIFSFLLCNGCTIDEVSNVSGSTLYPLAKVIMNHSQKVRKMYTL